MGTRSLTFVYDSFTKARVAMWEAHKLWEEYLRTKMKTHFINTNGFISNLKTVNVENISPTCIECGKSYFSIPRLGIFHICSKD